MDLPGVNFIPFQRKPMDKVAERSPGTSASSGYTGLYWTILDYTGLSNVPKMQRWGGLKYCNGPSGCSGTWGGTLGPSLWTMAIGGDVVMPI